PAQRHSYTPFNDAACEAARPPRKRRAHHPTAPHRENGKVRVIAVRLNRLVVNGQQLVMQARQPPGY
ncbi:hypothetical protein, partial [Cronobacter sakazakii]|uniref:hypothetical protein n=1 Tax=Cronobacter sakazakii TaxID=28141 RepID=UPI00195D881C